MYKDTQVSEVLSSLRLFLLYYIHFYETFETPNYLNFLSLSKSLFGRPSSKKHRNLRRIQSKELFKNPQQSKAVLGRNVVSSNYR